MIIGFDLDGVLCDINVTQLILIQNLPSAEVSYYKERRPLLNPAQFLTNGDRYIIVTARRKDLGILTKRWIRRYLPNAKLFSIETGFTKNVKKIAEKKLKILKRENAEVYFDDNPEIIKELRQMDNNIKFIQYGGRLT